MYFVYSGLVGVYIVEPDTKKKTLFQSLPQGSNFNQINGMMEHSSIFEFVAETDTNLLMLSKDEIVQLSRKNANIRSIQKLSLIKKANNSTDVNSIM